ncbi:hypothetical protein Gotur_022953 [Gossypium turneri]
MLGGLNWIPYLSVLWSKDGDRRHTYFIFPAVSVQLHLRTLVYNSVYQSMGKLLWGQLLVPIGVQNASNYRGRCLTSLRVAESR